MAHKVNNKTRILPNETGKPTETHFVYPASLKNNARLMSFRNFIRIDLFSRMRIYKISCIIFYISTKFYQIYLKRKKLIYHVIILF